VLLMLCVCFVLFRRRERLVWFCVWGWLRGARCRWGGGGDLRLESAICLFHQRFSTNTVPRWPLAQPFRYLAHNGEINTITGNRQWARARTYKFQTPLIPDLHDAAPFVNETGSDYSSVDNLLELLLVGGMDIIRSMLLLVSPALKSNLDMDPELLAFFDFTSVLL
ncbi:hypothetical protein PV939_10555, partial [Ligilactobacillus salivarius]|nr:hypothetical protein [Ligilactobacillus salivarius]